MIKDIINGNDIEKILEKSINELHKSGPSNPVLFEKLAYIKKFHQSILEKYESKIVSLTGLFYKIEEPNSMLEEVYSIFSDAIENETGKKLTPVQAGIYKGIRDKKYFSFSAPTSAGKSHLFRELIKDTKEDIVIVVPSRALISEYYLEVIKLVDKSVLVLQFIDNINTDNTIRRIFIITPERGSELFKYTNQFNIALFLMDEAQISEEEVRGLKFDSFVRRIDKSFGDAKKVFAHPFVNNPEAQLQKHNFIKSASSKSYDQNSVGKIFISNAKNKFTYFSPNVDCPQVKTRSNIVNETIKNNGTLLVYISKSKIYERRYIYDFGKYIKLCKRIRDKNALDIIERLRSFIGATEEDKNNDKSSYLLEMMKKGVVIHHGSLPLKARLLIEEFIKLGYAQICFATSTLNQGINMPFDVVWIDNFTRMDTLTIKNLIGRSGRNTPLINSFDYGYTIVNKRNVKTFIKRYTKSFNISNSSQLDSDIDNINEDLIDIVEAIKNDEFDDELHITKNQIERIINHDINDDIKFILDNLMFDNKPLTAAKYYQLGDHERRKIKSAFKKIYISHLRRNELSPAETSVLSTAIPIMLWHIQGKSFSEIVSLRHAFLSEKDSRRAITSRLNNNLISERRAKKELQRIKVRYTPIPSQLPNKSLRRASLFPQNTSAESLDFDTIVFDTYDYLDKVISLSLTDPICAALKIYCDKFNDQRGVALNNYLRYGTNDNTEIWLLRYGFNFDDIEWIIDHIQDINQLKITFKPSIYQVNDDHLKIVERFL